MRIAAQSVARFSSALLELYQPTTIEELPARLVRVLFKLMGNEFACWSQVNLATGEFTAAHEPAVDVTPVAPPLLEYLPEHPFWARREDLAGTGAAHAISDFLPSPAFAKTTLFNEVYRILGVDDQLGICAKPEENVFLFLFLNRNNTGFGEEDRTLMTMLRPHVLQALQNAQFLSELERENLALNSASDEPGRVVVVFNSEAKVLYHNRRAQLCIERWFEAGLNGRLPESLRRWVSDQIKLTQPDCATVGTNWRLEKEGRSLSVRLIFSQTPGEYVLLLDEKEKPHPLILETKLGLTKREAEVLFWVSQGKRNAEIAIILGTTPKTITKHLERIFAKLGVETRTSAANAALELLGP